MAYSDQVSEIEARLEESVREIPESTPNTLPNAATSRRQIPSFIRILGAGIISDVRARTPWYLSDWTDAWNYRVVPATAHIFFANVLPGIAFSLDLIETTQQYGVAEVLISSFMAAFVFSVFGAQPLTIAGVTGPITVFNKTVYRIIAEQPNAPNYLQFIGWVYLWAAIIHWATAILNLCNFLKFVTIFSCDIFGFYVSWVYIQYGVQVITRQFNGDFDGALVGVILALLMLVTSFFFQHYSETVLFHRHIRRFLSDYGMPISLVAASGMAYWGRFKASNPSTLPVGGAFQAANGRAWLVKFWELDGKWVGIALPFGIILWILFFFDHNISVQIPIAVVEQRVSNLAQGVLCLVLLTDPFLHILGLVPRGVLAGLFWFMGTDALQDNGITIKLLYLIRDKTLTSPDDPLRKVRISRLLMFVTIQLVAFGAMFVITQTIAAIGFPVIFVLLIPLRTYVIPRLPFTQEELFILDRPASAAFSFVST
ncbi:hypothetical protein M405DRAFT_750815 [Rhizopogon salebrosus TDB-379]|nr:hypothetical protein M405DRAFT_750815 [Rhizopogon salebrosus TDB-379]